MSDPDDDRRARWDRWREFRTAPKKPPPEHGIKIKKAGTTWWGQRWIEALERVLQGDARRLGRGRTYARAGRVHDLRVEGGKVLARVTGSRPQPYQVTIQLAQLADADWERAIAALAERAQFSAELLGGEMPKAIDEAFRAAGSRLFPETREELETNCSCPDWGNPCKHVAATHYVLGEALDRDPFLLFELRGRSKERVLDELRRARSGASPAISAGTPRTPSAPPPGTSIDLAAYDRAPAALPALAFSFDEPASHAAVLRQLGAPSAWKQEDVSPVEALAPLVQRAAEAARRIALAEPAPPEGEPAPHTPLKRTAAPRTAKKRAAKSARRPPKR